MKELTLSQQYTVIAFNGLESLHPSMAKEATLRAIAAARILEEVLRKETGESTEPVQNEAENARVFADAVNQAVECAKSLKKKEGKELETEMFTSLETDGLMEQVPDILGCDMNYYTAGVELKAYRSEEKIYLCLREGLRAEVLDEGEISLECAVLLWLYRESGCIHDLFSVTEQTEVQERMLDLAAKNEKYNVLWQAEFHSALENFAEKFLRIKKNLFRNPYLQGVNLIFPFLERRNAIFIDFVVFGTNVVERRTAVMEHLCKMGHYVEEIKIENETLLKIDNAYYRVFPATKRAYKVPIQGADIIPVYW